MIANASVVVERQHAELAINVIAFAFWQVPDEVDIGVIERSALAITIFCQVILNCLTNLEIIHDIVIETKVMAAFSQWNGGCRREA